MKYIQKDIKIFRKKGIFCYYSSVIRLFLDSVLLDFYFSEKIPIKEKKNILIN
tara:strand:- start:357 stop:515 length:159 start_codon:yes stop_codon:yes gene_type:complete